MKILKKSESAKVCKKNNFKDWCYENNRLDLLEEWDYEKNNISPSEISYGSHKPIYWICKNHHSFEADTNNRTIRNSGCPYCTNKKIMSGFNDFETWCKKNNRMDLLIEWDYEKNVVKPKEISYGSATLIWWKCEKQHSYDMLLKQRTSEYYGCPYCSNHRVLKGFNDFESWCKRNNREDLLAEWDYKKNEVAPDEVVYTHAYKIWWKCKSNHSYSAILCSRNFNNNTGCPYCANQLVLTGFNDFASWCTKNDKQYFLKEWDYKKNIIKPTEVMRGNKEKFWWICEKGHSYHSNLNCRTSHNNGCPYCSGSAVLEGYNDFATWCKQNNRMELLEEWDYTKNILKPTEISMGNGRLIWWKCKNHQSYQSRLLVHIKGKGCPICLNRKVLQGYNDFATWCEKSNRKDLLDEWASSNSIKPTEITYGSQASIEWGCKECGCKWSSQLKSRTGINNTGCPHCSQSKGEKKISNYLSTNGINYMPQYRFNDCRNIIPLPFDFAVFMGEKVLIIEYDGEQHYRPIPFNGNMDDARKQFIETKKHDKIKTKYCINNGIPLLRIPYTRFEDAEQLIEDFIKNMDEDR